MNGVGISKVRPAARIHSICGATHLEEVILGVGLDGHVRGRVGHAGEGEAIRELVIVKERLLGVVERAGLDLAGAGRAGASTARVRKVDARLLSSVEDVGVIGALHLEGARRVVEGDLVVKGASAGPRGGHRREGRDRGGGEGEDNKAEHLQVGG
eukprot:CAMPEP_0119541542 /NCGR_PEP_ID=MMETSP1344-20130328/53016_1 /TAXON_ID=236787 /ORGANISM="Florenciella parvula, Strain CCMP2471" /LENGTH=154 /DNA_ID=CAMNT_0007585537 /DNA_START=194 /DNA_END=658 /DNA_ORIENTATION=-